MFYRVRADLIFSIDDEARDFYHDCQLALAKSSIINPNTEEQEPSSIQLEECYHDESPTIPCKTLASETNETPLPE